MRFQDLYIGANSLSHQGASIPLYLATGNFNFKLKFTMKKLTVYTKRSPCHKDHCDIIFLRNALN